MADYGGDRAESDDERQTSKVMGIVVDAVSEVHNFASEEIQPSPEMSDNANTAFIEGLGVSVIRW